MRLHLTLRINFDGTIATPLDFRQTSTDTERPDMTSSYVLSFLPLMWIVLIEVIVVQKASGAVVNIALHKPAVMRSIYNNHKHGPGRAVDGDTTTLMHSDDTGYSSAWWKVDLQRVVQNATVKIYFRIDNKYRRNGVQLHTSTTPFSSYPDGRLCHTVTGRADGSDINSIVSVICPGSWRHLLVYTKTDNGPSSKNGVMLDFGEVQVLVCSNGTYGTTCDKSCSSRQCSVPSTSCERYTWACPPGGCKAGWLGNDCTTVCDPERYGLGCQMSCGERNCANSSSPCDHVTGECDDGCLLGWNTSDCTQECMNGTYGPNCVKSCSDRQCRTPSSSCDRETGQCPDGCRDGWSGKDCSLECMNETYGPNCVKSCSDRHCRTPSSSCDRETGQCPDGCRAGWSGKDCSLECDSNHYGVECSGVCEIRHCSRNSSCDFVTGSCDEGCEAGWMGKNCLEEILLSWAQAEVQIAVIAGSVAAAGVVVILLISVLIWRRRRGRPRKMSNAEEVYYNTVTPKIKVKNPGSEVRPEESFPVGQNDSGANNCSTMDSLNQGGNGGETNMANPVSDVGKQDYYEPVHTDRPTCLFSI